jgi:SAM-dependent methyltransferase
MTREVDVTAESKPAVSPERIIKAAWGYAAPLILEAGVRVGLYDALAGGPKMAAEVQTATGASERGVRIILNALVGLGLLTKNGPTQYALTPEADAFLVSSKPAYLGGFLRHTSSHLIPKWLGLTDIVQSGRPAEAVNQEKTGAEFFEKFVEDLFPLNFAAANALADALRIDQATSPVTVLDLAAGSGVWSIALAKRSPRVRVTAVDWPGVLPATQRTAERHGVGDRFRLVAGDLLSVDFGTGYQVATLGHILHSEGEARSRKLLAKTAAAMAPGGTIAIAEWLVDADRTGPPMGLIFAVNMLVNTDQGDTFSFEEIAGWLKAAGFVEPRMLEAPGPGPLVLATKTG